jgi:hypothetical protein
MHRLLHLTAVGNAPDELVRELAHLVLELVDLAREERVEELGTSGDRAD